MSEPFHPEMKRIVEAMSRLPVYQDLNLQRAALTGFYVAIGPPRPPEIEIRDETLETDGLAVPVRIYRAPGPDGPRPVVMYFHGGGWVLGNLDSNDAIAWGIALGTGALVVNVDYRLAPEHRYPAAFDDCYAATRYMAEHGADLGADASRIAVAGDSAGGNLAAAVSLAARDRGGPAIAAQGLVYPVVDDDLERPSYVQHAQSPTLTREKMRLYLDAYLGKPPRDPDGYALPIRAQDLSGLPPALVTTAELDPLRDEGLDFANRLRAAGVRTDYRGARRMVHGFLRARHHGRALAEEFKALCGFLKTRLGL